MMLLSLETIREYSEKYNKFSEKRNPRGISDSQIEGKLKKIFSNRNYLSLDELEELYYWKSPRIAHHAKKNSKDEIQSILTDSLSTSNECERVVRLQCLRGASWPVASVILHFAFPDKYPILDFRALCSLGWIKDHVSPVYNICYWEKYCEEIRKISRKYKLSIRDIDKALWMYCKEKHGKKKTTR